MKNNKHTEFEQIFKESLINYELPYSEEEWLDFEKKLKNETNFVEKPTKKFKKFFNRNFKNILLLLSLITNILIILLFLFFQNKNQQIISKIIEKETPNYSQNINQKTNNYSQLEKRIDSLQEYYIKLNKTKFFIRETTKELIVYDTISYKTDKKQKDSLKVEKTILTPFKIDTINIKTKNEELIIAKKQKTDYSEYYLPENLKQPPLFKDKRGKYHLIIDLVDYISSEFQPSNLKKTYNEEISCFFTFFIDKAGKVQKAKPISIKEPEIEKEVIRILYGMPEWKAGITTEGDTIITRINFKFEINFKKSNPFPNF